MRYLNLGCGDRFHPNWENGDLYPNDPGVRFVDLLKKIPYGDETFDVVYHSHVLEHFARKAAFFFLTECHRVLKPGGVVRVVVPDLERIARLYLEALEKASSGVPGWDANHEWMVMEMYDQCVREGPSGAFMEFFRQDPIPNWDFIRERWGATATPFLENFRRNNPPGQKPSPKLGRAWGYVFGNLGTVIRNKILQLLIGRRNCEALAVGRFRRSGEIHMWMYDSYSLGQLLKKAGFVHPQQVGPSDSKVPNWSSFHLDTEADGGIYKADSMYMEAVKP
jgi:SAM-dependent methyltransferase